MARRILLSPADRERTAYHEAGHALLVLLVPGSDSVHRISIVPRGLGQAKEIGPESLDEKEIRNVTGLGEESPVRESTRRSA